MIENKEISMETNENETIEVIKPKSITRGGIIIFYLYILKYTH
jgi:hypothetical protein